ncbi:MAG: hypothetical protein AB1389_05160 [Campylobacterota bacterium]|jgi:hypothetical protein
MKFVTRILVIASLGLLLFSGCSRKGEVLNINNNAVASTEKATIQDVGNAIIRAGVGLGWSMKKVKDGEIQGTIALRTHTATISITYDTKEYSIKYVDSTNLDYNPTNNTIHKNYNGWIQNLNKAIQAQISLLAL